MLLTGLLFVSVIACGQALILEATETRGTQKLTPNINITCSYEGKDHGPKLPAVIFEISIQKFENGSKWKTVAELDLDNGTVTTTFADVKTSGVVGNPSDTFLTLHFDIASENSIGLFQCEVKGFDTSDEIKVIKSNKVNIYERDVSPDDLLNLILELNATEHTNELRLGSLEKAVRLLKSQGNSRESAITGIKQTMNIIHNNLKKTNDNLKKNNDDLKKNKSDLKTTNSNLKRTNDNLKKANADLKKNKEDLKKTKKDLIKVQSQLQAELNIIKKKVIARGHPWPEGRYALLNTSSGCPDSGTFDWDWEESYAQITTQSGKTNQDKTSTPIHLSENPIEKLRGRNVFTLRFCTKKTRLEGPAWPQGSYCINSFRWNDCPAHFRRGSIAIGRAKSVVIDKRKNIDSVGDYPGYTSMWFCCRHDQRAEQPMLLPSQDPFYLYRHGGKCQEVIGMDVSNEWIYLDSGNNARDRYSNNYYPDGHIKNVRIEICYYTPKA